IIFFAVGEVRDQIPSTPYINTNVIKEGSVIARSGATKQSIELIPAACLPDRQGRLLRWARNDNVTAFNTFDRIFER
ncbi:MAG: hypothetical protein ACREIQ_10485, partial [Nitrospiria bacterium]